MPLFTGEIRHYPRFKTDFEKQVMPTINEENAPYILRSCLSKEPADVVESIDDDLDTMWKRLDEKYGDPAKIVDVIMYAIQNTRNLKDGENKKFVEFINIVEDGYRDLERLGLEKEITTTSSVSVIEKKLPTDVRKEWAKLVSSEDSTVNKMDKFPSLLKFLLNQKQAIEYENADLQLNNDSKKDCGVNDCTKKHHVTLHEEKQEVDVPASANMCNNRDVDTCLLQVQRIRTKKGWANVLWDNRASLCFITNKKAKDEKLKGIRAKLSIVKVGSVNEKLVSYKYKLTLIDKKGQELQIDVYGIDKITSNIQAVNLDGVHRLFKDVTKEEIARPTGEVDVLIGFEYAGFHPQKEQFLGHLLLLKNQMHWWNSSANQRNK